MIWGWIFTAILAVVSAVCLLGKGAWLSTWYNSLPTGEKEKYSEKKVSVTIGFYYFILCVSLVLFLMFLKADVSDIIQISVSVLYFLLVVLYIFFMHKNSFKNCKK